MDRPEGERLDCTCPADTTSWRGVMEWSIGTECLADLCVSLMQAGPLERECEYQSQARGSRESRLI